MTIEFFLPMRKIPTVTHQEKQVRIIKGKPSFYEPAELADARTKYMDYLGQYVPNEKLIGPVRLITKWIFFRNVSNEQWKTTKPDTDNMIKLFKDCLTKLAYWKDDAQVASEITEKFWSPIESHCGIYVKIETLEELK